MAKPAKSGGAKPYEITKAVEAAESSMAIKSVRGQTVGGGKKK
jgi:hypothetical protein